MNINKKCLFVGNFGILSVVVCNAFTANTSLRIGLKYLLKITHFISNYPIVTEFFTFETLILDKSKKQYYVRKKIPQK